MYRSLQNHQRMKFTPYLIFDGQCKAAFDHYARVFGGEIRELNTYAQAPAEMPVPDSHKDRIMHVSLHLDETVLMGADLGPGQEYVPGNQVHISVNVTDEQQAKAVFEGLAEGGTITMPFQKTFWGAWFGMCTDAWGMHWMVNCQIDQAG